MELNEQLLPILVRYYTNDGELRLRYSEDITPNYCIMSDDGCVLLKMTEEEMGKVAGYCIKHNIIINTSTI